MNSKIYPVSPISFRARIVLGKPPKTKGLTFLTKSSENESNFSCKIFFKNILSKFSKSDKKKSKLIKKFKMSIQVKLPS